MSVMVCEYRMGWADVGAGARADSGLTLETGPGLRPELTLETGLGPGPGTGTNLLASSLISHWYA
ncbi:hypothetical protein [Paenibacillus sp. NPDC058174]|uniref:hypothetical protein n=1 Tax=Paenibacillus sp. NPDC058174 TaxID=3346366 RepID=UPI0036D869ED